MFNQNNDEEKKLDWMYKGPNSTVNREEYLLGRPVDKTLEQLNEEDKQKQQGLIPQPKNRVEHECIPPSIRDFNKLVQAEQVDLSTKLQEDPLVAIKKREEETRRQFLQNPVQLKKLQKALKAQQAKKKKKKKKSRKDSSDSDSDLDKKLTEKLLGAKNKKSAKEERNLDIILMHKFEALKDKLSENDLQDILNGKITESDESSEDEKPKKKSRKKYQSSEDSEDERKKSHKNVNRRDYRGKERSRGRDSSSDSRRERDRKHERSRDRLHNKDFHKEYSQGDRRHTKRGRSPRRRSSSEPESNVKTRQAKKYDSDDSDSSTKKKINYGLVTSDGIKIPLSKKYDDKKDEKSKASKISAPPPPVQRHRAKKLTEEEKEKLRREMMQDALIRDKERAYNLKKHREREEQERKEQNFDPEFVHKQLVKSANTSSIESRIKSNLNNIQRSSRDMDKHFSRR